MRYASIRKMDIVNGEGIGVSLFVQGCPFHCKGCFNQETWDFNGGKEFTKEIEKKFIKLISQPSITRVSFLGGEPMCYPNYLTSLIKKIKDIDPNIKIWLWSGFSYENIITNKERSNLLYHLDYLIDGKYIEELKNLNLKWRGSSNQRIWEKDSNGIWNINMKM